MFSRSRRSMSESAPVAATVELREVLVAAHNDGRSLLFPYMTAGLPDRETSIDMFTAMSDAGADGFEVGIPYSDPLMDGPTIHEAGLKAIAEGMTMTRGLDLAAEVRARTGKPVIVMSYVNPVLKMGVRVFADAARAGGVGAVILADLPADEAAAFRGDLGGLGLVLFVAPTTGSARLRQVVAADPAFIYGVAEVGVTGERSAASGRAREMSTQIRAMTDLPLVLGVGISTPGHAAAAAEVSDGVIVGSALVRLVLDAATSEQAAASLQAAVSDLAAAVHG